MLYISQSRITDILMEFKISALETCLKKSDTNKKNYYKNKNTAKINFLVEWVILIQKW